MARDHARIHTAIWGDGDFRALPERAQNLWFTILSQGRLSYCGVIDYLPTRLAQMSSSATAKSVQANAKVLEDARFAVIDCDTGELLVRSFVRHDGLLAQPNVTKAMAKDYEAVISERLRGAIETELRRAYHEDREAKGWEALRKSYPDLHAKATTKDSGKGSNEG